MKEITIGIACDGVTYEINKKQWYINQEDDPTNSLKEIFEELDCKVTIFENY